VNRAMDDGSLSPAGCAGQEDLPATAPVVDRFGAQTQRPLASGTGVRASNKSARAWEAAYRHYGITWELTARSPKGDPAAARQMAAASAAVASAWRQIATATTLPWWTLVALEAAASAFEAQAREYKAREISQGHNHG
jgi:hypothetical protein